MSAPQLSPQREQCSGIYVESLESLEHHNPTLALLQRGLAAEEGIGTPYVRVRVLSIVFRGSMSERVWKFDRPELDAIRPSPS